MAVFIFPFQKLLFLRSLHFHVQVFKLLSYSPNLFKTEYRKRKNKNQKISGVQSRRYSSDRSHNKLFCWCLEKKFIPSISTIFSMAFENNCPFCLAPQLGATYNWHLLLQNLLSKWVITSIHFSGEMSRHDTFQK